MKAFMALSVMLVLLSTAHAAEVFVWDRDEGDQLQDPNGHATIGTDYAITRALEALGHNVILSQSVYLPATLIGYDIVFSLHGWYDC